MQEIITIIVILIVRILFIAIDIAMLLRVIFSWLFPEEDNALIRLAYGVTEPIIYPVRALCSRMGWFDDSPLDVPFFITALLLTLLSSFLI